MITRVIVTSSTKFPILLAAVGTVKAPQIARKVQHLTLNSSNRSIFRGSLCPSPLILFLFDLLGVSFFPFDASMNFLADPA
ncbi:hypothetical protein J5N97_015830 [Dioscorea zingiberensis]|uniref:Uncharacterized protein n=1 Tax=Dioscorea zingiberensis TaxID=325984 RepID=A0A9D5CIW0_9LILI|nr:hypothetical protein J5N97_015830 [Dioscorea zingiberensis]